MAGGWQTVVGLEVHVQLRTRSKIFSGAPVAFGAPPNSCVGPVDFAMPGTMPVLNAAALQMAVRFGLAVGAQINRRSVFERKNYFYPDLPKGYQLTQMQEPIVGAGSIDIVLPDGGERSIRIHHAHLEEDAGKSLHEGLGGEHSGLDLNRAGTALLEVVSEPDMRSSQEAGLYLRQIHAIVTAIGICDGDMSQGSLRCDVNVSVRRPGSDEYGVRTEIKNINSFRFVERAIESEAARQIAILESGGAVPPQTLLYDEGRDTTAPMRDKDTVTDYRYFPCPDLLPVVIDDAFIESERARLPELPAARCQRLADSCGLSPYAASVLAQDAASADYFEAVLQAAPGQGQAAANWMMGDMAARRNREGLGMADCPVAAAQLAALLLRIDDGSISHKMAKDIFAALWDGAGTVDEIIRARGLSQQSDPQVLAALVAEVIAECDEQVRAWRAATPERRKKMFGFFVGQAMKRSSGRANPAQLGELLRAALED